MAHFEIAENWLLGRVREPLTRTEERDVRRYYNTINACQKGSRRRARQAKSFIFKMVRKHRARHLSRS